MQIKHVCISTKLQKELPDEKQRAVSWHQRPPSASPTTPASVLVLLSNSRARHHPERPGRRRRPTAPTLGPSYVQRPPPPPNAIRIRITPDVRRAFPPPAFGIVRCGGFCYVLRVGLLARPSFIRPGGVAIARGYWGALDRFRYIQSVPVFG